MAKLLLMVFLRLNGKSITTIVKEDILTNGMYNRYFNVNISNTRLLIIFITKDKHRSYTRIFLIMSYM